MRVTTLGMLAVDGEPVRGERLATVVRVLLDARGRPVQASSLVDAIWGPDEPRDATGAVQALVSRARRLGLPVLAAKALTVVITVAVNYIGMKLWVFRKAETGAGS